MMLFIIIVSDYHPSIHSNSPTGVAIFAQGPTNCATSCSGKIYNADRSPLSSDIYYCGTASAWTAHSSYYYLASSRRNSVRYSCPS